MPLKGTSPVINSQRTTPYDQTSVDWLAGLLCINSGLIHGNVLVFKYSIRRVRVCTVIRHKLCHSTNPVIVILVVWIPNLELPKSQILQIISSPSVVINTTDKKHNKKNQLILLASGRIRKPGAFFTIVRLQVTMNDLHGSLRMQVVHAQWDLVRPFQQQTQAELFVDIMLAYKLMQRAVLGILLNRGID